MENTEEVKNPEVELDTDGVKDQTLEVEEQKVETSEPELPKEEVDLGYTEPKPEGIEGIKVETIKEEPKKEIKEDSLSDVSEKVKRRIDKLTFKIRESERREKAALDYARGLKSQLDDTKNRFSKTSKSYIEQFSARVVAEQEDAKKALRDAIADQDADKIAEANSRIAQLAVEAEKVKMTQAEEEAKEEKAKAEAKVEQPIQQAPQTNVAQPSGKAKEWAEKNEWFGSDKIMTSAAFQAHNDLVEQGFDAESDEYYNEIDKVMKENFPHKFSQPQEQKKPVQTVASAQRNQTGRRSVKLTKSQIVIAKKLGVPLEEYAKYVKENANG
jgi:murein DD-endopeptidase MepM/ murein hydrolase activator NlpD